MASERALGPGEWSLVHCSRSSRSTAEPDSELLVTFVELPIVLPPAVAGIRWHVAG